MEGKMNTGRERERNDCFLLLLLVSLLGLTVGCGGGAGTVRQTPQPNIVLSPMTLAFSAIMGGTAPSGQTLMVENTGTAALNWTAAAGQSWCHVAPTSGNVAVGGNIALTVTVAAPTSVGTSTCMVSVAGSDADNSPQAATVNYVVKAGTCPTTGNVVSLTPAVITVGGISAAAAPVGFSGGTF